MAKRDQGEEILVIPGGTRMDLPRYYIVGLRPVKVVETEERGMAIYALSWKTGEFVLDMWYLAELEKAGNIVYNADRELGFINADGSGAMTIYYLPRRSEFALPNLGRPLITTDNRMLIVTNGLFPISAGDVYVGSRGKYAVLCKEWRVNYVQFAGDGQHLLLSSPEGLMQYSPEKIYKGILGYLSLNEQYVAKLEWVGSSRIEKPMITIRQLDTGLVPG